MEPIQVCTLGEFSLRHSSNTIRESGSRSRRVWNLLAFLICHRGQSFSQQKLITLLWGSEPGAANPENTLRLLMHRTRATLDQLYEGAGRDCLLRRDSGYCWNPQIPVAADMDRFEQLCRSEDPGQLLEALSLYHGEFLGRLSCEDWAIPICAHFQNLFLETSQKAAGLLLGLQRYEEAVRICRRCIAAEPYFEPAYQTLMQTLAAMGDPKSAAQVYEDLSRLLFDDFGIRPSEETRAVYRTAVHTPKDRALPMEEVLEQLQESQPQPGALLCDYDYFKVLCHAESRDLERSGTATH